MAKDSVDTACKMLGKNAPCVSDQRPFPGGLHREYDDYLKEAVPDMAARHRVGEETVRHLVRFYGSGAERVLDLVDVDRALGQAISPESRDLYAQVVYSVLEEGARTLSDIILRRMHLGMTGSRGVRQADKIADIAAQELKWGVGEKQHHIESFLKEIHKDNECLK